MEADLKVPFFYYRDTKEFRQSIDRKGLTILRCDESGDWSEYVGCFGNKNWGKSNVFIVITIIINVWQNDTDERKEIPYDQKCCRELSFYMSGVNDEFEDAYAEFLGVWIQVMTLIYHLK